jgi:hypothetical protein
MADGDKEPPELGMSLDDIIAMKRKGGLKRKGEESFEDKEARKARALNMSLDDIIKEGGDRQQGKVFKKIDNHSGGRQTNSTSGSRTNNPKYQQGDQQQQRFFKVDYEWSTEGGDEIFSVTMFGTIVVRIVSSGNVHVDLSCKKSFGSFRALNTVLKPVDLSVTFDGTVGEGDWTIKLANSKWAKLLSSGPM